MYNKDMFKAILKDRLLLLSIAVALFVSCGGTHGHIKRYQFTSSKSELSQHIRAVIQDENLSLPDSLNNLKVYYGIDFLDSDSVNFYVQLNGLRENSRLIFWCKIMGGTENWTEESCFLDLVGYREGNYKFLFLDKDISKAEKEKVLKIFEDKFLKKIL
ncbi:hypothetical protein [Sphingobacterium hungaricum]|uniref:Lipoprotein n=1 Tax=Sphingobacterium hungaricum TaxID=2082723 RepID=A0A928YQ64_9SPHI|nr:hypothetical protein [Sphingobacterium hungaricum]MBE8712680.1 hypothetical protein [Sphingobacterium hungaricum]